VLENQTEHSNALIYLGGSLDRGVSSDSSGNYTIQFSDSDSVQTGTFTVYYFLFDYELDSAFIWLENGLVKMDTMDVDSNGIISVKELNQIIRVRLWTDREEYSIGDSIVVNGRYTNLSNDTLFIFFSSAYSEMGIISLYRDFESTIFSFFPADRIFVDISILLPPGGIYEGLEGNITIPERSSYTFEPIILINYVVVDGLSLPDQIENLPVEMISFILHEWHNLNRGPPPIPDAAPNKFELPIVRIVE